ncbi:MAG: carbohydrate ABC transporter permease [Roseburia faecis]|nr:carbohydrate ABC transporter permease [Lachnospiraceae bacterium]MDY6281249.1 carbohydrate ABC transporter permease [Roseburia faecis]
MSTKTKSKTAHNRVIYTIIYIILIFCAVLCVFPFFWMITTSFKSTAEAYSFPPTILPKRWLFSNFVNGLQAADFGRFTVNTVLLVIVNTVATVLSSAFVAYGFAKFPARGSKFWYTCLMATMMLPGQVTLIPQYLLYYKFHMVDTYWPLIIPSILGGGAYNIFLYRQFFLSLPKELSEAAMIDGANSFQTFTHVMLPSVKPVSMCVGVMSLVWNWNDFYNPLIYINTTSKFTVSIGLQFLNSSMGTTKIGQMMAVALIMTIPVMVIFFICQKYFVEGIKMSGIKG